MPDGGAGFGVPGRRPGARAGPGCVRGAAVRAGLRSAVLDRLRRGSGGAGGGGVSRGLREIAAPFVAAAPSGTRVRTRLRVSAGDVEVLAAAGRHLGSLAGRDLAARCAEGRLDARGRAASRARRKRALTAESASGGAGPLPRASEDAYRLAARNLAAERRSLKARVQTIGARLAVPAG